jgi:hypothetical protein
VEARQVANDSLLQLAGLPSGAPLSPGGRLRYVGFAIYGASHDDYGESVFPTGLPIGTCQDGLETSCGLDLNNPAAWTGSSTNLRA